jgi:predicted dehydrogenase
MSETRSSRLRVGIVGAGWIGRVHGRAWQSNSQRARIVAVADVSRPRAEGLSLSFAEGEAHLHADLASLLADPEVEAVDLCLPHNLHRDAIVAALGAGKHVLTEKPLCLSLEEARSIRAAVGSSDARFMSAHNQLFSPPLVEARRLLREGILGPLYVVRSNEAGRSSGFRTLRPPDEKLPSGESSWAWRLDPARSGGGELLDTGWHAVYRLLSLADSRPVEVTAMLANLYLSELGAREDTGAVLVRFESGALGLLLSSWAFSELPVGWSFQASGAHGSLAGTATRLVHGATGFATAAERDFERVDTFALEIAHFLDVVLDGAECQASFEHAARALQLILGAYRSADEKRTVALPADPTEL